METQAHSIASFLISPQNNKLSRIVTRLSYGRVPFLTPASLCVALMHTELVHSLDAILSFRKIQARFDVLIVRTPDQTAPLPCKHDALPQMNVAQRPALT
jgi:hypothetical protein